MTNLFIGFASTISILGGLHALLSPTIIDGVSMLTILTR